MTEMTRNFSWLLVAAGALTSLGCADDAGTGGGASTGSGQPGDFSLNDIIIEVADSDAADPGIRPPVNMYLGWMNCPTGEDCGEAELEINGVPIGTFNDLITLPLATLEQLRAAISPGGDVTVSYAFTGASVAFSGSFPPFRCPNDFSIVEPTATVTTPAALPVRWTALSGVALSDGLNNSGFASASQWDTDLDLDHGLLANVVLKETDVTKTLDLPAKFSDADVLIVAVGAAGPLVKSPQGGEGSCTLVREVVVPLQ